MAYKEVKIIKVGGSSGKRFWARAYGDGTKKTLTVDACSTGSPETCETLPAGMYQLAVTVKRRAGSDPTVQNYLTIRVMNGSNVFYEWNDGIATGVPAGTDVNFTHVALIEVTKDRDIHDFAITVEEATEKSEKIAVYASIIEA